MPDDITILGTPIIQVSLKVGKHYSCEPCQVRWNGDINECWCCGHPGEQIDTGGTVQVFQSGGPQPFTISDAITRES